MSISRIGTIPVSFTCTAATRPSAPVLGQTIMVTDRGNRIEWWDGTNWRYGLSNIFQHIRYTGGNITTNGTTETTLSTALDFTLPAVAGDVIQVTLNINTNNEAIDTCIDIATWVSGAPVNYFGEGLGSGLFGEAGLFCNASTFNRMSGVTTRTLVSGDISGGLVVGRLRTKNLAGGNKIVFATTGAAITVTARNLGPCASGALTAN